MGFWAKSLRIFTCLCANAPQSIRHLAQQTGLSKSSVHRLQHAMERRNSHPEFWLWETAEGRHWLTRLVVATLYTFASAPLSAQTITAIPSHITSDKPVYVNQARPARAGLTLLPINLRRYTNIDSVQSGQHCTVPSSDQTKARIGPSCEITNTVLPLHAAAKSIAEL